jgi:NAD(P)-dependent dehydrogenase (short-subunit alcohol dehydrogenase family)
MDSKVVVITGASSGLGLASAVQLARKGHTVYATLRDPTKSQGLRDAAASSGVKVEILPLDVRQPESIRACFDEVVAREGRLDVLLNNAGLASIRTLEQATASEIAEIIEVNFTGVLYATRLALPIMRAQGHGHLIAVSSVGGLVGQPLNELYCAAKFAVEGLYESLATYLEPYFGIKVSLLEPAGFASNFVTTALGKMQQSGFILEDAYKPVVETYLAPLLSAAGGESRADGQGGFQTAEQVAEVVVRCVQGELSGLRHRTSAWGEAFCELKTRADPDGSQLVNAVRKQQLGLD